MSQLSCREALKALEKIKSIKITKPIKKELEELEKYSENELVHKDKVEEVIGCDTVVIVGNKELAKEWLEKLWLNDKNNAIVDSYMNYRHDQISVAQKLTKGKANGVVYVINFDDCFVLETSEDLFYFSQTDDEWLEDVSNESCNEIAEWLEERGINYIMEED